VSFVGVKRSHVVVGAEAAAPVRDFWRQTALLLAVLGVVNGSNYAFHVVVSRMLGPSDYGALAALLAVLLVMSVPFGVIQTAVAHKAAAARAAGRPQDVRPLALTALKTTTVLAYVAGFVVAVVGAPLLSIFLRVDLGSALLLAPYVVASIPASVAQGVLQGERRFGALASVQLTAAVLRLGLGIAFVWAGLGVPGAVLATAASAVLVLPIAFRLLHIGRTAWRAAARRAASVRGEIAPALYGLTSFWLLAEIDIALARHFLDADTSGYYSSAGVIARAILFLPSAVGLVAFPRFVAAGRESAEQMRWLRISVAGVGALSLTAFLVLLVLREPLIRIAFGERYLPAAELLPILAVAMGWLAVANVLVYFHIALRSRAYLISLVAVPIEVVAIGFFHDEAEHVALVVAVTAATVAFFQYQAAASIVRWQPRREPSDVEPPLALSHAATLELSVVLPCHNAASGIRSVLTRLLDQLEPAGSFEIIVVSDGSTDETVEIARSLESRGVRVIEYPHREGKGHALKIGLREARGAYVAFCDADGDIAADAIEPFLTLMRLYGPDIVLGSKRHPLSEVYYPPVRRLLSWVYHKLTRVLFRVNVRDTQTGFKLIRRDVLAVVLPRLFEKRYAFDLEFLVVARRFGFTRVFEAPVTIHYRFASQVNLGSAAGIMRDTLAIFYRHYVLNSYGQDDRGATVAGRDDRSSDHLRVLVLNWRDMQNPEAGGAERFVHEVARRWVAKGHDVTQVASRFPGAAPTAEIDGVRVRRLGRLRTGSFHLRVQRELARVRGYDLVLESINTIPYLTPLWRRRLPPTIAIVHQLADDVWNAEFGRVRAAIGRRLELALLGLYRDSSVVAVSGSTRADLQRLGFTNVRVVANGCDEPPPHVRELAKASVPTFLFVGRLAANKRPDHAVAAFRAIRRELPEARLWIVGQGPMERALAADLPPGAEMLGRVPRLELYERMARAHCLLVPSVREGWGLVVIEANTVGTPAVGYAVAGLRDSIRPRETGMLVPPGDPDALAREAASLVTDPRRYAEIQKAAAAWAAGFSWDSTADQLLEIALSPEPEPLPVDGTAEPALFGRMP
jgi:glycosyltransferase involved in cell wall biosynthesis/O-antigen/teichoic acid export membrane protein